MEYVHGVSLGDRLKKKGPIPPAEMIDYAAQSALGLAHAHEQGIVHRDVKPTNILLTEDRKVKLLDLGLGVLMEADTAATFATADGIAVGTVDYMSPEQACGRDVDGRSDLYSLGCAMYHLMTAKLPFIGTSPIERLGKRISGRHVPITEHLPDLPANFVRVLDKLMAHKPHERFATAAEAAEALQSLDPAQEQNCGVRFSRSLRRPHFRQAGFWRSRADGRAQARGGRAAPSALDFENPACLSSLVCTRGAVCGTRPTATLVTAIGALVGILAVGAGIGLAVGLALK